MGTKREQKFRGLGGNPEIGAYTILDYNTGNVLATLPLQQGEVPMMCALNDKFLIVTGQGMKA